MRGFLIVAGATILAMPGMGHGQNARKVQLVAMGVVGIPDTPTIDEPTSPPLASPLPDAFRVHDLSRRYVEYRMFQEFKAGLGADPDQSVVASGAITARVASASSIAVPGWMSPQGFPIADISCTPAVYRPSGLLSRSAEARRQAYYGMMSAIACEQGIPTGLFDAVIMRESGYNPSAVSPAKAYGLAQLMPGTAADLGVNRYDPAQNLRGGARYLRQQLDRFGQVRLGLAAYNAGPSRVRNRRVPRISETQAYVANIVANWWRLSSRLDDHPNDEYTGIAYRTTTVSTF